MTHAFDAPVDTGDLPYLTPDLPGVGGRLKARPEDFLVEEQPLYHPCGDGEHVYLLVEKREMSTLDMVGVVARHFGVEPSDVGYAGMKDKHAVTRQVVSVYAPGRRPEDFPMLAHDGLSVLWTDMHTNKLRLGHLRGNRFSIRVRAVEATGVVRARAVFDELARRGAPNYVGAQRFGFRRTNHRCGKLLLLGDHAGVLDAVLGPGPGGPPRAAARYAAGDYRGALEAAAGLPSHERRMLERLAAGWRPKRIVRDVARAQRRFWISAFQSAVFNRIVADRVERHALGQLELGDLAWRHDSGACFRVREDELGPDLDARLAALEVSPSGPLWGGRMTEASGEPGRREREALEAAGVSPAAMAAGARAAGVGLSGARRPLRIPVVDPELEGGVDEHGPFIRCAFELPAGAFATMVMREVMKGDPDAPAGTGGPG